MLLKPENRKTTKDFSEKRFQETMNELMPAIKKTQKKYRGFIYRKPTKFVSQEAINKIQKSGRGKNDRPLIPSLSSVETYRTCLNVVETFLRENKLASLKFLTIQVAEYFLLQKSQEYAPPTLKKYRQALQLILRAYGRLSWKKALTTYPTKYQSHDAPRAYTYDEVCAICERMSERNALSVWIAYYAGLRAHEFLDIQRQNERGPTVRPANSYKFVGATGKFYTVRGKSALIRNVLLPLWLVEKVEARRKTKFTRKIDRKISYNPRYDLGAGSNLSRAFTRASKKALGFSRGFHGLRHSYAQNRFMTVLRLTSDVNVALETISQEIGHFRPSITKIYLRGLGLPKILSV